MKIVYFAWVRERVGRQQEDVTLPKGVNTVADLMTWLSGRGEEYAHAFASRATIRAAINKVHVKPDTLLAGATEIAFFPPMTGG